MTLRTCLKNHLAIPAALALVLAACTDAGPKRKPATLEEAPTATSSGEATAEAKEAATPAALGPPIALAVALEGRTSPLTLDLVGERAMISRQGTLYALDRGGALVETYARLPGELRHAEVVKVGGREGGSTFLIADAGGRGSSAPILHFYDDGAWERPRAASQWVVDAWPWIDASTLALVTSDDMEEDRSYRLTVVRGAPKGPKFDKPCEEASLSARDVDSGGAIALVFSCPFANWAWTWRPGDDAGEMTELNDHRANVSAVDVRGDRAAIALVDDVRTILSERDAAGWRSDAAPGVGDVFDVTFDPEGVLYFSRGATIHRREGAGWVDASPPGEAVIQLVAGIDVGTPWVARDDGLFVRRAGVWSRAEIPAAPFVGDRELRIRKLKVSPSGQAWLLGEFRAIHGGRGAKRHFYDVLTSGEVGHPQRIGVLLDEQEDPRGDDPAIGPTPWPRIPGPACTERLVLLAALDRERRALTLKVAPRRLRGRSEFAEVRFVEVQLGEASLFAAIARDATTDDALLELGRKLSPLRTPELACGDPAELEAAKVEIVRTFQVDFATGALTPR